MKDTEILDIYAGLTEAQFADLKAAYLGQLSNMNGARRQAMQELIVVDAITNNLRTTALGNLVYEETYDCLNGRIPEGEWFEDYLGDLSGRSLAAKMRKIEGFEWVRSEHAKLLIGLGKCPGQAYRHLVKGYGERTIREAHEKGWFVEIGRIPWARLYLSAYGRHVLERVVAPF